MTCSLMGGLTLCQPAQFVRTLELAETVHESLRCRRWSSPEECCLAAVAEIVSEIGIRLLTVLALSILSSGPTVHLPEATVLQAQSMKQDLDAPRCRGWELKSLIRCNLAVPLGSV